MDTDWRAPVTAIHRRSVNVTTAVLILVLTGAQAQAQQRTARSFEQLQFLVEPGDRISVMNGAGEQIAGRILTLTPSELVVSVNGIRRAFVPTEPLRIRQRRGDSLSNGIWIGVGVGLGLVALAAAADESGDLSAPIVLFAGGVYAAMGAGIGAGVDALIRSRQTIFDTTLQPRAVVTIRPTLGHGRLGASVGWRF
jgi:hypothetical protein